MTWSVKTRGCSKKKKNNRVKLEDRLGVGLMTKLDQDDRLRARPSRQASRAK